MILSILVAKTMALVYLSVGVGVLTGSLNFKKLAEDFSKSAGLAYVSGFITLIIGVALVQYHNLWVKNWTVLVTFIGWACLVKGIMLIAYPKYISKFKAVYKNTNAIGFLMLVLGLTLGYFGFFG